MQYTKWLLFCILGKQDRTLYIFNLICLQNILTFLQIKICSFLFLFVRFKIPDNSEYIFSYINTSGLHNLNTSSLQDLHISSIQGRKDHKYLFQNFHKSNQDKRICKHANLYLDIKLLYIKCISCTLLQCIKSKSCDIAHNQGFSYNTLLHNQQHMSLF